MHTSRRRPRGRAFVLLLLCTLGAGGASLRAQSLPPLFRDFLSQYAGKEVLLLNISSDSLQFADADSTGRYVVVLDSIRGDMMMVHRETGTDKRAFSYPLADIRRVTYLFAGHPYRRIVIEMF